MPKGRSVVARMDQIVNDFVAPLQLLSRSDDPLPGPHVRTTASCRDNKPE